MREVINFKETMKKGIVLWIIAHLLLFVLSTSQNEGSLYDEQINKLHCPVNFAMQVLYAGAMYTALEIVFKYFIDNVFKASSTGDKKALYKNSIYAVLLVAIVCLSMYFVKEIDLVNKVILKLMIAVIFIKAMASVIITVRNNTVYNQKLRKINEK